MFKIGKAIEKTDKMFAQKNVPAGPAIPGKNKTELVKSILNVATLTVHLSLPVKLLRKCSLFYCLDHF